MRGVVAQDLVLARRADEKISYYSSNDRNRQRIWRHRRGAGAGGIVEDQETGEHAYEAGMPAPDDLATLTRLLDATLAVRARVETGARVPGLQPRQA